MRLLRLAIDGFGRFGGGWTLPETGEFGSGLVVICGPNESGKSTLLAFVRRVLYGFPGGNTKANPYPPLSGGRHGGRLLISDTGGRRLWIERHAGTRGGALEIREQTGTDLLPQVALHEALANVPPEVFERVFAFGLAELANFESLDQQGVKERIYSAGIGSVTPPAVAAQEIEKQQKSVLVKQSGKATIKAGVIDLKSKHRELRALDDPQSKYESLSGDLARTTQERQLLAEQMAAAQEAKIRMDRLLNAWPEFVAHRSALHDVDEIGDVRFPVSGLERYDLLSSKLAELHEALTQLDSQLDEVNGEIAETHVDEPLLASETDVASLHRGLEKYRAARSDEPKRAAELRAAEDALTEDLQYLGPNWDEDMLRACDFSLPRREEIRQWRTRIDGAQQDAQLVVTREASATSEQEKARDAHEAAEGKAGKLTLPADVERLSYRLDAIRQARVLCQELARDEQAEVALTDRIGDKQSQRASVTDDRLQTTLPEWLEWGCFAAAVIVGIVMLKWFSVSTALLGVLLLALGAGLRWVRVQSLRVAGEARRQHEERQMRLEAEIEGMEGDRCQKTRGREGTTAKLEMPLKVLGLGAPPSAFELEALSSRLDAEKGQSDAWALAQDSLATADAALTRAVKALENARTLRQRAQEDAEREQAQWCEWLRQQSLPEGLTPDGALEFFSKAEAANTRLGQVEELRRRIGGIRTVIEDYGSAARVVLRACGRGDKVDDGFIDRLMQDLTAARRTHDRVESLRIKRPDLEQKREGLLRQITARESEQASLFDAAGVGDEECFREAGAKTERREAASAEADKARRSLQVLFGTGETLDAAIAELEGASPAALEMSGRALAERLSELQEESREADERVGQLGLEIRGVATDERASRLRAEIATLREDVLLQSRQWAALAVARAVLRRAQTKYERERRPQVIEESEQFFRTIVGDVCHLISPTGESRIELETSDGRRRSVTELSRGTAEQLYLALRFGYLRELSRHGQSLPLIMDDVLVNFDPVRARGAAAAIVQLAQTHQVCLFTCHPETVALVQDVLPEVEVHDLAG